MKNFKRITKRGLSLFIALVMCMSVMSLTAFAEGEDDLLITESETVELIEESADDVEEPADVEESTGVEEPADVEESTDVEEPADVEEPTDVEEPADVEESTDVEEPADVEESTDVEEPADVEEPTEDEELIEDVEPVAEVDIPFVSVIYITANGEDYFDEVDGSYVMNMPATTLVTGCEVTLIASQEVTFVKTENPAIGDLYVSSVTDDGIVKLNFKVANGMLDGDEYALTLTSDDDGATWIGRFGNGFSNMTLQGLANELESYSIRLAPGAMNGTSPEQRMLFNSDVKNVMMILCAPDAAVYEVTYVVKDNGTYTWNLVAGMDIPMAEFAVAADQKITGWYNDADYNDPLTGSEKVTGNKIIYVDVEATSTGNAVLDALNNGTTVYIGTLDDWNTFAANSSLAKENQLVQLTDDINCGNKVYASLDFKGNLNGLYNGKVCTISNATFTKVTTTYTGSTEEVTSCGMFSAIRTGQKIANLNLKSIRASDISATYSGPLAGIVDGGYVAAYPVVQNVQVESCSAQGRSAGGVIGYARCATIQYCSSKNTTIGGVANGGGIVGMNSSQSKVAYCFSTCSPTALPTALGGRTGGAVAKNLRSGRVEYCWSTATPVVGINDSASSDFCLVVDSNTTSDTFNTTLGTAVWSTFQGVSTTFNSNAIIFDNF